MQSISDIAREIANEPSKYETHGSPPARLSTKPLASYLITLRISPIPFSRPRLPASSRSTLPYLFTLGSYRRTCSRRRWLPGNRLFTSNGLSQRIKNTEGLNEMPIIAITAKAMPSDVEKGMQAGFEDYLTKPLDIVEFLALIDRYLSNNSGQSSQRD